MAAETTRTSANLAAEFATAYTELVLAEARVEDAMTAGDVAAFDQSRAAARTLRARIGRIELELAVIRSLAA